MPEESNTDPAIEIAVADDSAAIRDLLSEVVHFEPKFELVASFDNGRDVVAWAREGNGADVFVIDMRLPGLSGTATISALRRHVPDSRILAFSASAQEESVRSALAAGADGYLLKESSLNELTSAISGRSSDSSLVPAETLNPAAPTKNAAAPGDGLLVLVVDDHELVRDAIRAMLESQGFSVAVSASASDTVGWLSSGNRCDAALVDLRLGDASGASIVENFREHCPLSAVILHSGAPDQDGERIAKDTGADGFLAKGDYTIDQMVEHILGRIDDRRSSVSH